MKINEIIGALNHWAPPSYQESYDNARLITGSPDQDLTSILISLDCTEEVVQEAIDKKANLIIAHHPIVFKGLKSFTGKNYVERTVIKAIKNDIAIFSIHTNLDSVHTGVNHMICERIGLSNCKTLAPKSGLLTQLVTFVPSTQSSTVLDALYKAGLGQIGNYDECSFQSQGMGSFRPNSQANPAIGKADTRETVEETRIEGIFPSHLKNKIISALKKSHPYEEIAYYLTALDNENQEVGAGMVGELYSPMATGDFFQLLKDKFNLQVIRHTAFHKNEVKKIAVCGGSGSFLLGHALRMGADVFVTADFKYHEFFDAEQKTIIADIGHYESEVFTKELICNFLKEKFANIALNLSEVDTNPIKYF
ncbi:Nif3-like dinuclear metal center hexameric protein [Reichenbachiella carrageenanivorans]|uniref:GTP cyclohydrolase 1 type 2 homolog n=1 Tax=Reichenbachiella carrageenanivorans TaxID=2979869 RepID=A0ABY6D270_9BACT|nr:Nif3-like dinuclear metal center hexameric protein [Reichenbachiella carrageenanivorans]UXX79168.1 Nif3-like dinuclear metal center hexameric protein [Reichenbachiella carrageenanivorans]